MKKKTKTTTTAESKCNVAPTQDYLRASSLGLWLLLSLLLPAAALGSEQLKVVYAVNAGGDEHTDRNGIHYEADGLNVGIASDYGKHLLMIGRVHEADELLYRTERYHTTTFGYDFPSDGDGDYALIMKFCEVYFDAPQRKVFDVLLNRKHTVVRQLDIYSEVGRGSAHDEIIYFKISNGRLHFKGEVSDVRNGRLRLDFIKGALDNPKINAFALLKGDADKLPRLPTEAETSDEELGGHLKPAEAPKEEQQERIVNYNELDNEDNDDEDHDDDDEDDDDDYLPNEEPKEQQQQPQKTKGVQSGPRQPNPYSIDDSSILLPVFIAIGAFIPLLFCLCKL